MVKTIEPFVSEEQPFLLRPERRIIRNRHTMVGLPVVTWRQEVRPQQHINAAAQGKVSK
jgi:hypothetical protein